MSIALGFHIEAQRLEVLELEIRLEPLEPRGTHPDDETTQDIHDQDRDPPLKTRLLSDPFLNAEARKRSQNTTEENAQVGDE